MPEMSSIHFSFPDTVPLVQWEDGSIRVQGTRLLLAMIVTAFQQGDTADEINDSFPSASVTQIEAVIDWYLNNKSEADAYLKEREAAAEKMRQEIESTPEYQARRAELHRRIAELRKTYIH